MVFVPAAGPDAVTESGKPAARAEGVRFLRSEGGAAVYEIGSGRYSFIAKLPGKILGDAPAPHLEILEADAEGRRFRPHPVIVLRRIDEQGIGEDRIPVEAEGAPVLEIDPARAALGPVLAADLADPGRERARRR